MKKIILSIITFLILTICTSCGKETSLFYRYEYNGYLDTLGYIIVEYDTDDYSQTEVSNILSKVEELFKLEYKTEREEEHRRIAKVERPLERIREHLHIPSSYVSPEEREHHIDHRDPLRVLALVLQSAEDKIGPFGLSPGRS